MKEFHEFTEYLDDDCRSMMVESVWKFMSTTKSYIVHSTPKVHGQTKVRVWRRCWDDKIRINIVPMIKTIRPRETHGHINDESDRHSQNHQLCKLRVRIKSKIKLRIKAFAWEKNTSSLTLFREGLLRHKIRHMSRTKDDTREAGFKNPKEAWGSCSRHKKTTLHLDGTRHVSVCV